MAIMESYISTVGRSIPTIIQSAQETRMKGHWAWVRFYGYYSLNVKWWVKIKLVFQNGRGLKL